MRFLCTIVLFLSGLSIPSATACDGSCECGGSGKVKKLCPVTRKVTKIVTETCYRDEERTETVMVPKTITVEKQVPYEYTAWVRVTKEDVQEFEVKTPKFRWVDQKYTITVPGKDTVTKVRKRTECVPVTVTKTCMEDQGHWETKMVAAEGCGGCLCTEKKVWCPKMVEVTKEVTEMQEVCVDEPYTCEIDICVPIEKTRRVKEYFTKTEKKTVKHPYTTLEPRKRTKMVTACVPETVYEEQTKVCTVKVPYTVEREVCEEVTEMVQQWVDCPCGCH